MNSHIIVREYEEGDQYGIVELMKPYWPHFDVEAALMNWEWEYQRSPHKSIITVAEHAGRIVGHYSVLPMSMKFREGLLLGGKAEGSAIHPDYRRGAATRFMEGGKPLFRELIRETFKRSRNKGIQLIWGFPNKRALCGQVRAGYKHIIVPVSRFVFPPNLRNVPRALLSTFKGSPSLRKTLRRVSTSIPRLVSIKEEPSDRSFVELSENLHGIERLWKSFFEENDCITLERTPDYLSWRIVGNPIVPHNIFAVERGDQISAYLSLAVRDSSECLMVDMLTLKDSLEDLRILLHRALTLLKGKSSLVTTWLTKNKVSAGYARMLCHTGFVELPESRMDMLVKTFDLSEEYSANVENWLINPIFTEGIS